MSVLLRAHVTHIQAAGYSPRTVADRQRLLTTMDRRLPYGIDIASPDELAGYLSTPGWSAWTRATYYRHIRGFYRWAVETTGALDWDPSAGLTRPRNPDADPHPVTDDELHTALARSDLWWRLAISLAAYAGLRASELARLKREHVTADELTVWHGKGDKTKRLPTHPEIWRLVRTRPGGWLLPNRHGRAHTDMTTLARRHFNAIGMPGLHLHRFRHWFATSLLRAGADIITVRDLMRHASITSTQVYLLGVDGQRRLAVNTLPVPSSPHEDAA